MTNHAHRIAPSLTWATDAQRSRATSNFGHVITGARLTSGAVVYNAWSGEPHQSKHLSQGIAENGLDTCKQACERDALLKLQQSSNRADGARGD